MSRNKKIGLIVASISILVCGICGILGFVGYYFIEPEIRVAACMLGGAKQACPKIYFVERGGYEELEAGVPISGKSGLYTVTPPSDIWLKRGEYAAREMDLGILSDWGTGQLDFKIYPITDETAESRAEAGIQWAINLDKTSNGTLESISVDIADVDVEGHIKKYCWKGDSGLSTCAYSYFIPYGNQFIEAKGSSKVTGNQVEELEEMIFSIELVTEK